MNEPILHNSTVFGVERCPQCGVSTPLITKIGSAERHRKRSHQAGYDYWYFTGRCSRCLNHILFYGACSQQVSGNNQPTEITIKITHPALETAAEELPPMAAKFLQQALESKHAPDGAMMLAASSIDAMLKDQGYSNGSLFSRIQSACKDHLLTDGMASWAHEIRLSANEPRHADDNFEGASKDDAEQILAFAKALGEYLYVLPARVQKWQVKAGETETT